MSTILPSAGTLAIIANAATQEAANSDVLNVSADGEYTFAFTQNGAFSALGFNLMRFSGYTRVAQQSIDATITTALTVRLIAGISYQLLCSAFAGGISVTVSVTGPNAPAPIPPTQVEITDPIEVTTPLPVSIIVAGPEEGDPGFPMIVRGL